MKGRISDLSKLSPLVLAIREKIARAKAEGNALVFLAPKPQPDPDWHKRAELQYLLDDREFAKIEKQMG